MQTYKVINADQFSIGVKDILKDLDDELKGRIPKAVDAACKVGVKKTKAKWKAKESPTSLAKGSYKSGFTYKVDIVSRFNVRGTIYNKKYAGLVHLLEKGHNTLGGGRVSGNKHLAVEETHEELVKQLLEEVGEVIG